MPSVIIDDILPRTQLIAVAGQTVFNTTWTANTASDITVYSRADGVEPDDLAQEVPPYQYNVQFIGAGQIVQVTFLVPRDLDDIVTIVRNTPASRLNLYSNTNFVPSMMNNDFGIMTMVDQQNELYDTQIALRYNVSATLENYIDNIIPVLPERCSWRMNTTRTFIEAVEMATMEDLNNHGGGGSTGPSGASLIGLNPTGTVQDLADALHVLRQPSPTMPNAFALSALTSGVLRNNTGSGILQITNQLTSLDNLTVDVNKYPLGLSSGVYQLGDISDVSINLLAQTTTAAWRGVLGVGLASDALQVANNLSDLSNVPNARTNLGLGSMALESAADYLPLAGGTMTGSLILAGAPTIGSEAATKAYVDAVTQNNEPACNVATTTDLTGWVYNNGTAGVGATLTAPSTGVPIFDTVSLLLNMRVLVKDQIASLQNGIYVVTNTGAVGLCTLTRATDYDQPTEIQAGDITSVIQGSTWQASQWMMTSPGTIVIGTSPITWAQIAGQGALLRANNLSDLTSVSQALINLTLGTPTGTGNVVRDNSPSITNANLVTPALGTPSNGNLTNCTGYTLSNLVGLGTNVATFLATPNSANLAAAVADETGSGFLVFNNSPTIVAPRINSIYGSNNNPVVLFGDVPSAANYIAINNAAAGSAVGIGASGTDTNINFALAGKGNGAILLLGGTNGSNIFSGYVGETTSVVVPQPSSVSLTSGVTANIAAMNITPGRWLTFGSVFTSAPTMNFQRSWIGPIAAPPEYTANNTAAGAGFAQTVPCRYFSVTTTTTIYLSVQSAFTGAGTACGNIFAIRLP